MQLSTQMLVFVSVYDTVRERPFDVPGHVCSPAPAWIWDGLDTDRLEWLCATEHLLQRVPLASASCVLCCRRRSGHVRMTTRIYMGCVSSIALGYLGGSVRFYTHASTQFSKAISQTGGVASLSGQLQITVNGTVQQRSTTVNKRTVALWLTCE